MSRILNQIKEAQDSLKGVDERKAQESKVLESLNSFQDKVICLCNRLNSLSETLDKTLILKEI